MFDTRTADVPGVGAADAGRVAVRRDRRQERRSLVGRRIQRSHPAAESRRPGEFIEYLLPRQTNVRRVFVDNSTTPVTFWVGSNHGASIVKLEPLDGRQADRADRRRFLAGALASLGGLAALARDASRPVRHVRAGAGANRREAAPHRHAPSLRAAGLGGGGEGAAAAAAGEHHVDAGEVDRGHGSRRRRRRRRLDHESRAVVRRRGGDTASRARVQRLRRDAGAGASRRASACSPRCRCRTSTPR